jgi:nitrogen fixation protein NifZ
MEPAVPKFRWGQRVQAAVDLFNDGSFPEQPAEALLARSGELGEIVQVGTHVETNTPVYLVEFAARRVIGCLQGEIAALGPAPLRDAPNHSEPT